MGRIRTKLIKRTANQLLNTYKERFSTEFNENKQKVDLFADIRSKKLRNVIAGYVTRLAKRSSTKD